MAIVYKSNKRKRARTHGFLTRTKTAKGRAMIKRRMHKGRKRLGA